MSTPINFPTWLVGLTSGAIATLNVGGAGRLLIQDALDVTLCTLTLNNPAFGTPNATTGIALLNTSPSITNTVSVSGIIAKYVFRNNASTNLFAGIAGVFSYTADATTNVLNCASHPFVNNNTVSIDSTTTPPTGLLINTVYYVVNSVLGSTLQLSLTIGGTPIDLLDIGSGSHRIFNSICSLKVTAVVVAGDAITINSFSFDPEA